MKNPHNNQDQIIIICGPTASGKSRFALDMAKKIEGAIINADSMQIYNSLPLITASPSPDDKKQLPHFLYNFLSPDSSYSVAKYVEDCNQAIINAQKNNLIPIITGGTGMYINALLGGLSSIPEIDKSHREEIIKQAKEHGIKFIYEKLSEIDPESASRLNPADTQRIIRAYEIKSFTGKSILEFQQRNQPAILSNFNVKTYYIKPERKSLYETCDSRFLSIIQNGGIEEVAQFKNSYPNLETGPAKALGVAELSSYLAHETSLEEAIKQAQTKTRQYAKRQLTWFNNQITWEHEVKSF